MADIHIYKLLLISWADNATFYLTYYLTYFD